MRTGKLRAVLDTNIIVSGLISQRGAPYLILEALRAQMFDLVLSPPQRTEVRDVLLNRGLLQRYGIPPEELTQLLVLTNISQQGFPLRPLPVDVRDPKDEVILASALSGSADCLVTGDQDLLVLSHTADIAPLRIVTAREFIDLIDDNDHRPPAGQ